MRGCVFDWITALIAHTGYFGIALLMLAENVFPPIPSELIMPLAGFTAARGELSLAGVLLAGTAGSLAGALVWYEIGRRIGLRRLRRWADRHGRWLTMSPEDLDQAVEWFRRHAGAAVLVGRLIPAVRTLISVPAGVAEMKLGSFLAWTAGGTALWTALLVAAGYLLEDGYEQVSAWVNPVSNVIVGLIVLGYAYRVATFRPASRPGSVT
jgi:membrane protein DedA with SNARE-associated domain